MDESTGQPDQGGEPGAVPPESTPPEESGAPAEGDAPVPANPDRAAGDVPEESPATPDQEA